MNKVFYGSVLVSGIYLITFTDMTHTPFLLTKPVDLTKGRAHNDKLLISSEGLSLVIVNTLIMDTNSGLFQSTTPLALGTPWPQK